MAYKMKGFSGFGNSPMRQDRLKETGTGPRLPKAESMSTRTAPVITPTTGELVDPHHQMERDGYKKEGKIRSTSKKNMLQSFVDFIKSSKKK